MKKVLAIIVLILMIILTVISVIKLDPLLTNRLTIFTSSIISLLLAYLIALKKRKNGLIWGLIVGISLSFISMSIHYFFAQDFFNYLYLRIGIIIFSSASGGVIGVNQE